MNGHDIIVLGGSAGGIDALRKLVGSLPADLPASVFVVVHTTPDGPGLLPLILSRSGKLTASHPSDTDIIERSHIYVAPPDRHLIILNGHVHTERGPKQSRHRPSVDALFRSAAESYGPRVVGVVLSGNLDDGTAGLRAIKERGGVAIVQDPENAMYSGMPGNALKYVEVDHCLPLSEIGPLLDTLARDPVADRREMYPQEVTTAMKEETGLEPFFALTCPECHSSLLDNYSRKVPQFVCRVGHTYTPEGLLSQQSEALEQGLWSALRAVEERLQLTRLLSTAYYEDDSVLRRRLEEKAEQTLRRVEQLKAMLVDDDDWYSVAELFDAPSTIRNSDWTISAER